MLSTKISRSTQWKEYSQKKIISPVELASLVQSIRKKQQTIATLNGSFDLLHAGHLYMLFEAAKCADRLIVAVNSDHSIQQYKSLLRPIISMKDRMEMLSAIAFVDYVTWFDETDPREILKIIKPDVHVNGIEYGQDCIESQVVHENGGVVHLVDRITRPGLATTEIINKIIGTCA